MTRNVLVTNVHRKVHVMGGFKKPRKAMETGGFQ